MSAIAEPGSGRRSGAVLVLLLALMGAALVHALMNTPEPGSRQAGSAAAADPRKHPAAHADAARAAEVRRRFDEAVVMLHARQHEHAVTALHRVLELAPGLPEAHVNMGYALVGLKRHAAARDFFDAAIGLSPEQANAYYGLALAWEGLGDLKMAQGAMRTYLHRARHETEAHRARARAALWEWEQRMKASPAAR